MRSSIVQVSFVRVDGASANAMALCKKFNALQHIVEALTEI
jgi:hypothetical protein